MGLYLGNKKIKNIGVSFDIGGGVNTDDATLTSGDQMLEGVSAYSNGKKYIGTIPTKDVATPSISVSSSGLITANNVQDAGYTTGAIKTATKQLTTQVAKTVTPTTSEQTAVNSGVYTTGAVKVGAIQTETKSITSNGIYSPTSGKYFSSVNVNVSSSGTDTSDATATASDIVEGQTAYVNGTKVTGTRKKINYLDATDSIYAVDMDYQGGDVAAEDFRIAIGVSEPIALDNDDFCSAIFDISVGSAKQSEVLSGKTFTSHEGRQLTGTLVTYTYRTGSGTPSDSLGSDGDLYFDMG